MLETLSVRTEVWPLAADQTGIWLVSGTDAWRSIPVPHDNEPHAIVEEVLYAHGALDANALIHSTSWRMDRSALILTYVAVINPDQFVREAWPDAKPVTADVIEVVGSPEPSPVTSAPAPTYFHVLLHAVRHLRFLLETDDPIRNALDANWRSHLEAFTPVLAGMYREHPPPAIDLAPFQPDT